MRTDAQIMKAEKLSQPMVEAIALIGLGKAYQVRSGTMVALINRGIATTATLRTASRHLLTAKGAEIFREMNSHKPRPETTERYATVNAVGPVETDCKAQECDCDTEPPNDLTSIETAQATEYPQPKSATLVNLGAAQMLDSITADKAHQKDRDAMARSIAYEFSHRFLKWGAHDQVPEQPVVPRDGRPRMLEFYRNGSIWSAADLLTEIRIEMTATIGSIDPADPISRVDTVTAVTWLGWLHAYVLESGKLGDDGWQDRRRSPQDGWSELPLYSTEPSEAEELPAWADVEDGDSFGCVAVILPYPRYDDAESCGNGVTREEYYEQGSESAMCEQHRLAKIALDDKGW